MGLDYQVLPKTKDVPHKVMNTSSVKVMLKQQGIFLCPAVKPKCSGNKITTMPVYIIIVLFMA